MAAKKNPVRAAARPKRRRRVGSPAVTQMERGVHDEIGRMERLVADLKARIWKLPVAAFSGGSEEKRKTHNTLRMSVEHLKAAKAQVKAAAVATRTITRRIQA